MKKLILIALSWSLLAPTGDAATIALWNFSSNPPDGSTSSGTTTPAEGHGTAQLIGGVSATFSAGSSNDVPSDNSAWNTSGYPAQGMSNKTAGVRFDASTAGYTNISIRFDQRNSNGGSKYARLQFTTNGIDFDDLLIIEMPGPTNFYTFNASLSAVPDAGNNTNFAIRIVTEFESSATGAGVAGYVPSFPTASYAGNGTLRFDLVSISGDPIDAGNEPPSITEISDQTIPENSTTGPLAFIIGDFQSLPQDLILNWVSSDTNLVPAGSVVFGGIDSDRTVTVTPAPNQFGAATITIIVTDPGGLSTNESFVLTVSPLNAPPSISAIPPQSTLVNTPGSPASFTINDLESAAASLTLTPASSNPALVPPVNVTFGGSGADRTVSATPLPGQTGTTLITVTVTDEGGRSTSTSFVLMVIPTTNTLLYETFGYADGSLITNSAFFWSPHSASTGATGQTQVASGALTLRFSQSEDLHAPLTGSPFSTGGGTKLYSSFTVNLTDIPLPTGSYFAHFNSGVNFRARLFSGTANAAAGTYRLGVANAASAVSTQFPLDLSLSNTYTVVLRYDVDTASTTLWIDPASENDAGVTASDTTSAVAINDFSFRQAAGIGVIAIDEVKVARSFAEVLPDLGPRLEIGRLGSTVEVSWSTNAVDYTLQSSTDAAQRDSWQTASGTPTVSGDRYVLSVPDPAGNLFYRLRKSP